MDGPKVGAVITRMQRTDRRAPAGCTPVANSCPRGAALALGLSRSEIFIIMTSSCSCSICAEVFKFACCCTVTQAGSQSETTILLVRERYSLQGYQEFRYGVQTLQTGGGPRGWSNWSPWARPGSAQCCRRGAAARQVTYQP